MKMSIQSQHATTEQFAVVLVSHRWHGQCLRTKPVGVGTALCLRASANAVRPLSLTAQPKEESQAASRGSGS